MKTTGKGLNGRIGAYTRYTEYEWYLPRSIPQHSANRSKVIEEFTGQNVTGSHLNTHGMGQTISMKKQECNRFQSSTLGSLEEIRYFKAECNRFQVLNTRLIKEFNIQECNRFHPKTLSSLVSE